VAESEKDSYQGTPSGVPYKADGMEPGFSRCRDAGKAQRLKPFVLWAFGGIAKAMP